MSFAAYKAWSSKVLDEHQPRRLDCLNPFVAMSFTARPGPAEAASVDKALDTWSEVMMEELYRERMIATDGVRASLQVIFQAMGSSDHELWLPSDVYPFYLETADHWIARDRIGFYDTLPEPDFSPISDAGPRSVMVITNPVSPLGRYLDETEVARLRAWLAASPERVLVIDAVYAYRWGFSESSRALYATDQVFLLHSLSKAWLQRGLFGIVLPAERGLRDLDIAFMPPPAQAAGAALHALTEAVDHPYRQQMLFHREWVRRVPELESLGGPRTVFPRSGYLGLVEINFEEALERHNTLVVPASVFGSKRQDLSIVSCLYEMKAQYDRPSDDAHRS